MFRHSAVKCTRSSGKTSQQGLPPPFHSNIRHERALCQGLDQDASHGAISWATHKSLLNGCSACNHPTGASTSWEATCPCRAVAPGEAGETQSDTICSFEGSLMLFGPRHSYLSRMGEAKLSDIPKSGNQSTTSAMSEPTGAACGHK